MGERAKITLNEYNAKSLLKRDNLNLDSFYTSDLKTLIEVAQKEYKRLNNIKQDLLYVLSQLDGYLDKGWTIDLNFTDIREKYKQDIEEYEKWK